MIQIIKFMLPIAGLFEIVTPYGSQIRSLQVQRGEPALWIEGDNTKSIYQRKFIWVGTSYPIPEGTELCFIGTVQLEGGALVLHLYQVLDDSLAVTRSTETSAVRLGCNYLAEAGSVCNKCGQIHYAVV